MITPEREAEIRFYILALALQGIVVDAPMADALIETLDSLRELGEEFSLREASRIEAAIQERYNES